MNKLKYRNFMHSNFLHFNFKLEMQCNEKKFKIVIFLLTLMLILY